MTDYPKYWKQEPSGKHSWLLICPREKCGKIVSVLSDSATDAPYISRCAFCAAEMDKKKWASSKGKKR